MVGGMSPVHPDPDSLGSPTAEHGSFMLAKAGSRPALCWSYPVLAGYPEALYYYLR